MCSVGERRTNGHERVRYPVGEVVEAYREDREVGEEVR